jgi:glutathione reductase (NADPH)
VIGGGYIGVEFAGIFSRAGVEVTQIVRCDTVLRGFDEELRHAYGLELKKRGITLRTGEQTVAIERSPDASHLQIVLASGQRIATDLVLFATGRRPNTLGLGLAEVGVQQRGGPTGHGAIAVSPESRTSVDNIYAIGDCTDRVNLTPVAIAEGRAVAAALFSGQPGGIDYRNIATAVFGAPPLACVGMTEEQAREGGREIDVYATRFRPMKHTLSGRDTQTLMKLIVDRASGRVLGCHMIGADAPEIIQALAITLTCGATKAQFDATIALHPTAAEEFVLLRQPRPSSR